MSDHKIAAETFFAKVKAIEPKISGSIDENLIIRGSYRGKQTFAYSFMAQRFLFNNGERLISEPFEQALKAQN
jgi:hypothetical protein